MAQFYLFLVVLAAYYFFDMRTRKTIKKKETKRRGTKFRFFFRK